MEDPLKIGAKVLVKKRIAANCLIEREATIGHIYDDGRYSLWVTKHNGKKSMGGMLFKRNEFDPCDTLEDDEGVSSPSVVPGA